MPKRSLLVAVVGCATVILSGCEHDDNSAAESPLDVQVRQLAASQGLTGDPGAGRSLPDVGEPLVQLGMKLFFTKGLGGDMDAACVTCHHPALGGGDDLSLSIGVEAELPDVLGPGRVHSSTGTNYDGGPTVPRNAPTTFNIGFWDSVLFHDGRVESLLKADGANGAGGIRTPDADFGTVDPLAGGNLAAAQARFPVTSPEEMRGFTFEAGNGNEDVRTHLAGRLGGTLNELVVNHWLEEFRAGFDMPTATADELITYANIATAIGEYERSQVFIETPWKAYLEGDDGAISEEAKAGALLFFNTTEDGGAGCAACHRGDFFTDEGFHVLAMPQIGRGKGDGDNGSNDFGRFRETGEEIDRFAFRTPSLLNVTATGPWSHAGAYTTLEGVVRHHLNPQQAIDTYDVGQLDSGIDTSMMTANTQAAMDVLAANRVSGQFSPVLRDVSLDDTQVERLLAFLATLTDPCVEDRECLGRWIPGEQDIDPDNLRIIAVDGAGDPL